MFKIILQKDQKIFFTSDTHFNHKNICKATTQWDIKRAANSVRDFDSLDKMDSTIIDNINAIVGEDDVLIHFGDFSFNGFENIKKFRNRIICKNIYLITGNHDHHIVNNKDNIRSIFTKVCEYYTQLDLRYVEAEDGKVEKINMILSHFPICSWENMSKGYYHLHGHVHLSDKDKVGPGKSMDVGVDGNNYKPYSLTEIIYILDKQPIKPLCLPSDHHQIELKN